VTTYSRRLDLAALLAKKSFFLFGPRGTGKDHLIRETLLESAKSTRLYDLLDAGVFRRLLRRPELVGEETSANDLIIIDEVQHRWHAPRRDLIVSRAGANRRGALMRVVLTKDCHGGEKIVDIELPRPVAAADLDRFARTRIKQVFTTFPKPFFRLDIEGRFLLTGVLGEQVVRFTVRYSVASRADEVAIEGARELLGS
jgi:hypothetical protein